MPELVVVLVPVGLILCFLFLFMLQQGYSASLGAFLQLLATAFDNLSFNIRFIGNVGLKFIGDGIRAIDNAILHAIGAAMDATHVAFNASLHAIAYMIRETAATMGDLADGTEKSLQTLRHVVIPALIKSGTHWISVSLAAILKRLTALEHAAGSITHYVTHLVTHEVTHVVAKTTEITRTVYVKVPAAVTKAVAIPFPRIGALERTEAALGKRVKALEKVAGVAAVGVIASAVLGRLGLGWTRCSKVGRLGKALCGFPESAIDDLLAGAVIVAGSISIVELAKECQAFVTTAEDGLKFFVRELK